MLNIDQDRMQQVAQDAFDKVSGNRRWETAIAKAKAQLESNPYMHFDGKALLILSPSGEIYTANGSASAGRSPTISLAGIARRQGWFSVTTNRRTKAKRAR